MRECASDGMHEVTVVIPNWNGMKYLPDCLSSLHRQTGISCRIILIDNGSGDGSVEYVRENWPSVRIRAFHRNTGFCHAVNAGISLSRTPYVILLNNDTVCEPDFVLEMTEGMKRHPDAFSGSARMMQMYDRERIDDAGDFYCVLGWAFADGKGKPASARDREHQVFSACAGAAIYRREYLEQTGFFDERHFAYLEDVDLGYRAREAGYENWYFPKAVVYHAGSGASGSRYNSFKTELVSRNSVYLIRKHMPCWQIAVNSPFLLAGFLTKTAFFAKRGMGRLYVQGLMKGLGMEIPDGNRKMAVWRGKNAVKIQRELWKGLWIRVRNLMG